MYLIDANVLITAHNTYYSIEQVPKFWDWLRAMGEAAEIKMPWKFMKKSRTAAPMRRRTLCTPGSRIPITKQHCC
ncbi:MAG TPA: DUF4411 family protein [Rhizomicrobium sp.]|jgi:hypothetical protein|nr:DUF4411 family protein [Rhizomicrobium sp.]